MTTPTGSSNRTITGYIVTLLEYPRWLIERDVDFTDCHLHGRHEDTDEICGACEFGSACRWLSNNPDIPLAEAPFADLLGALRSAADYVRSARGAGDLHIPECDCDMCLWLQDANAFLRSHRHRA